MNEKNEQITILIGKYYIFIIIFTLKKTVPKSSPITNTQIMLYLIYNNKCTNKIICLLVQVREREEVKC